MATYPMHVAGLDRDFPICKVTDDLYIGAFIMFGDAELTVRCAEELLKLAEGIDYDYLFTAEAKSIPLIHEMARQSGAKKYFIARKGPKVYMPDPISVEDKSITTVAQQKLFLGSDDADLIRGKKILLVDDVISTGGSLKAMEALVEKAGEYEVDDPEILSAITCHTTGKPGMSLLDKILYVADYIEPRRSKAANLTAMRKLAFIDLDEACLEIMESILVYLKSTGCQIDPMTEAACEDMRRVVSERKKETAGEASAVTGITHQDKEEQSVESVKRNGKAGIYSPQ